jgi:hypothetical protein
MKPYSGSGSISKEENRLNQTKRKRCSLLPGKDHYFKLFMGDWYFLL